MNEMTVHVVEIVIALLGTGVTVFIAFIGLQIKNQSQVNSLEIAKRVHDVQEAIAENKLEITEKLHEVKMDLAQKHAENQRALAVHLAEDIQRFDTMAKMLERR